MSNKGQGSRPDHLTATTPDGKIELTEEELSRVSGGRKSAADFKFVNTGKDKLDTSL
jgi:bacteriocin-like protein